MVSELVSVNADFVLLLGDIGVFGFREIASQFPKRIINMGIMEQAMTSFGAGLALAGKTPILHSIAPFLVERALEQIKVDFGYQQLSGKLISVGASFDYGFLGATHHSPGDVAALLTVPGVNIFVPGNSDELEQQLRYDLPLSTLSYFRLAESEVRDPRVDLKNFSVQILESGSQKATVVAIGPALQAAREAAKALGLNLLYLNCLSEQSLIDLSLAILEQDCENLVLVQPFYDGTLLSQMDLSQKPMRVLDIGVPRQFIHEYGEFFQLEQFLGLDSASVIARVKDFVYKNGVSG